MATMGTDRWWRHEEQVAANPNVMSIGVGDDLVKVLEGMGVTSKRFSDLMKRNLDKGLGRADGFYRLNYDDGKVKIPFYLLTRKRCFDFGTKVDMTELGYDKACDEVDKRQFAGG